MKNETYIECSTFNNFYLRIKLECKSVVIAYLIEKNIQVPDELMLIKYSALQKLIDQRNEQIEASQSIPASTVQKAIDTTCKAFAYVGSLFMSSKPFCEQKISDERITQLFWFITQFNELEAKIEAEIFKKKETLETMLNQLDTLLSGGSALIKLKIQDIEQPEKLIEVKPFEEASRATSQWAASAMEFASHEHAKYCRAGLVNIVNNKICPGGIKGYIKEMEKLYTKALEAEVSKMPPQRPN